MTRKWIIGIAISVALLFMIYRMFTEHVSGVNEERLWFLSELHYDFTGEIDSVVNSNHILFHASKGHLDKNREEQLGEKLKYWGELILFRYQGDEIEMMVFGSGYQKGDSLYLNSDKNIIRLYHRSGSMREYPITGLLRGRPF